MKIMIFGTGAMGSIYAALFADIGHEVWAVDLWEDHLSAIREKGLRVEGASGNRTVQGIHATSNVADAGLCDLYIIATKASGVEAGAKAIAPQMGNNSLVITIQNGLGSGDRIAKYMPIENVLLGVAAGFGASMRGPGYAHHNAMNLIRLGEMKGGLTERLEKITAVWQEAGFSAKAFEDISQLIWEKYLCNITTAGPCTVFDCTLGELRAHPAHWQIAIGCALEAYTLGMAMKINFSFDDPVAYVSEFVERMPQAKPSMLQDHYAKRRSEIDAINGMAVTLGKRLNIPTPYNDVITAVIQQRELSF